MDFRKLAFGLGAFAAGAAAWVWGAGRYGDRVARALDTDASRDPGPSGTPAASRPASAPASTADGPVAEGHAVPDLAGADPVGADARAPEAFRPDPTAVPTAAEREALRPATGPAPSMVADRGSGFAEAAGAA